MTAREPKVPPNADDPAESERFIDTAREVEVDESPAQWTGPSRGWSGHQRRQPHPARDGPAVSPKARQRPTARHKAQITTIPITAVAAIPTEPEIPKGYSEWEAAAYRKGWNAAHNKSPHHDRSSYPTLGEREAFNRSWDVRTNLVLLDDLL